MARTKNHAIGGAAPTAIAMKAINHVSEHPKDPRHPTHQHGHGAFSNLAELAQKFADPTRDAWQRPDDVLRAMELSSTMMRRRFVMRP